MSLFGPGRGLIIESPSLPSASVTYRRPTSCLQNGAFIDDDDSDDATGNDNDDGLVVV